MLNDVSLLGVFEQLVGLAGCKPFDCVGTVAEACAALHMTAAQYKKQITSLPPDAVVYGNNFSSDNMCGTEEEKARHRRKDTHQLPVVLCELCARLHIEVGTGDDVFADNYTDSIMRRWGVDH